MDKTLLKSNNTDGFSSAVVVKGMYYDKDNDTVLPITDKRPPKSALTVSNVGYVVKEWAGPWWKGSCFKKARRKLVLKDISFQVKAGEITAILGNSGKTLFTLMPVLCVLISVYYQSKYSNK